MGRDLDPSHGAQGLAISGETSLKAVRMQSHLCWYLEEIFAVLGMEPLIYIV